MKKSVLTRETAGLVSSVQGLAVGIDFDFMFWNSSACGVTLPHHWLLNTGAQEVDSRHDWSVVGLWLYEYKNIIILIKTTL